MQSELPLATPKVHHASDDDPSLWPRDLAVFLGMAVAGFVACIFVVAIALNDLTEEQKERFVLPVSLEKAQMLGGMLAEYTHDHYAAVLFAHAFVYLYLQTFAIPGVLISNLLAGALFGMYVC